MSDGGMADDTAVAAAAGRDRRNHPRNRASDHSLIMKLASNGTGTWLLAAYRSGMLAGIVYAAMAWGDVRNAVEEFKELEVGRQLATIRAEVTAMKQRLDRIEWWRDGDRETAP